MDNKQGDIESTINYLYKRGKTFYTKTEHHYYYMYKYNKKHRNWSKYSFSKRDNSIILIHRGPLELIYEYYGEEFTTEDEFKLGAII
jgi:hypothetical protein